MNLRSFKFNRVYSFKFNRVYLDPHNMSNAGDFSWSWILKGFYSGSKRGRKICRGMFTPSIKRQIRRFHVVVVLWTSKKCTKKRDARAELLFWLLNLLLFSKPSLWSSSWLLKLPIDPFPLGKWTLKATYPAATSPGLPDWITFFWNLVLTSKDFTVDAVQSL